MEKDYARTNLGSDVRGMKNTIDYMVNSDLYQRDATFRKHVDTMNGSFQALEGHVKACLETK